MLLKDSPSCRIGSSSIPRFSGMDIDDVTSYVYAAWVDTTRYTCIHVGSTSRLFVLAPCATTC